MCLSASSVAVRFFPVVAVLLFLAGCTDSRVTLGQAYVAPSVLHLRADLAAKSSVVVDLKHGDHVQIVDVQRRFVRVRTDHGVEGWVDSVQLLSQAQMDQLKQRRHEQATLPSEGSATAYEALNIHIDPDRQSPAFAQILEGGSVQVLGHKVQPKGGPTVRTPGLVFSRPQALSRKQRREQQTRASSFKLPAKPAPPKPPSNWLEISAERIDGDSDSEKHPGATTPAPVPPVVPKPKPGPPPKRVVMEDWTLIKTRNNEIGWVLTRNLLMSIPDEVAQYAEGKHITSFFELGQVNDELKGPKHNWLWTTAAATLPNDFDSWRVFLWNTHKHRYETSFRQRQLEGYFPVQVETADSGSPLRTFRIITKDDDSKMRRRTYTFDGHLVHLANTEDYNASAAAGSQTASAINTNDLASKAPKPNWMKRQWANIRHRISGN